MLRFPRKTNDRRGRFSSNRRSADRRGLAVSQAEKAAGLLSVASATVVAEPLEGRLLLASNVTTTGFPTPLTALNPVGGLVYDGTTQGLINGPTDSNLFPVSLDAGQTATVILHPTTVDLQLTGQLLGPDGAAVVGPTPAASGGGDVVLPLRSPTTAGTYTIDVSAVGGTPGRYTAELLLNADAEAESHGGPSNDVPSLAQSLDGDFVPLGGAAGAAGLAGARRAAVVGTSDPVTGDDYAITLAAGQDLNLELGALTSGTFTMSVTDAKRNVLANSTSVSNGSLPVLAVRDFVAPAAGVYYVSVTGHAGGNVPVNYDLVALKGAEFETEPNDTLATAQRIDLTDAVLGSGSANDDYYWFTAAAGNRFTVSTATPGDGTGEPVNLFDPRIELYGPDNKLLASDDNSAPDGHNAILTYTAPTSGVYSVRVTSSNKTAGPYVLGVSGAVALPVPDAPDLLAAADSGVSAADNITNFNNATPGKALQFSVSRTTPGATVTVYMNGVAVGSATAPSPAAGNSANDGTVATVVTTSGAAALPDGTYTVTARQTLPGQAESPDSSALAVTIDTTAPPVPAPLRLQPASDSGASNTDGITNRNPTFDVSGAPYFHVYRNGTKIVEGYAVGTTYTAGASVSGTYAFTETSVDAAGNESAQSAPTVVNIDLSPPTASLSVPPVTSAGAGYFFTVTYSDNVAVDVGSLDNNDLLVTGIYGFYQYATLVSVNAAGNAPATVVATYHITPPGGSWDAADNGLYVFTLQSSQVRDLAGNYLNPVNNPGSQVSIQVAANSAGLTVGDGSAQRSVVRNLTLALPYPSAPAPGAFTLERLTTDASGNVLTATDVSAAVTWSNPTGDGETWVATFSRNSVAADASGSLTDGVYRLTVHASLLNSTGPAPSADQSFTFHRLFGDVDGNKSVNAADLARLRRAFGSTAGAAGYNPAFDYDGNGAINALDYAQFSRRFGTTLSYT